MSLKPKTTLSRLALLAGLILSSISISSVLAQAPPTPESGPLQAQGGSFFVKGKVLDATTKAPVPFATVSVLRMADSSMVTGALADDQGQFTVEKVPAGTYMVRVGFLGYSNSYMQVQLSPDAPLAALGNVILTQKTERLKEVVVEAERPVMQLGIDRKTFDVSRSNLNPGGSASDVLGNIPTVTVDQDGNVSMRNNENVTIYIDGRPSGITAQNRAAILRQIPASSIERIELITSPSARYDAEGVSGIINIILKKNKMEGMNGSLQAGIGNRNKQNASAALNYRNRWVNTSLNYNFRNQNRYANGNLDRLTFTSGIDPNALDSVNTYTKSGQNRQELNHNFKIASDFYLPGNQLIGFSAGLGLNKEDEVENTSYLFRTATSEDDGDGTFLRNRTASNAFRASDNLNKSVNQDYTLSYQKKFDDKGHELRLDGSYADYDNNLTGTFNQFGTLQTASAAFLNNPYQLQSNDTRTRTLIGQLDYIRPLANGAKLEAGLKDTRRQITNEYRYFSGETALNAPEVSIQHNDFVFNENTLAGYGILSKQWSKLGAQVGVRVERTWLDVSSRDTLTETPVRQAPYYFVNPTLNLSYKLNRLNEFNIGFNRRINRPGREQLNPFVDLSDPTTRRSGNPQVRPESINAVEGTWQYSPGQSTFTTTVFYRYTENMQTRIINVTPEGISTVTFGNAGHRNDYGIEAVARVVPLKGLSFTGSGALFGSEINSPFNTNGGVKKNTNYNFRILGSYQLPTGTNLQVTSGYRSPFILPQGKSRPFYNTDVAVSQELYKKKLQASIAVNDIFNTLRFGINTVGPNFDQTLVRKRETRFVTFTLTYRFGSPDNLSRRRDQRQNNQGGGSQGDMMF